MEEECSLPLDGVAVTPPVKCGLHPFARIRDDVGCPDCFFASLNIEPEGLDDEPPPAYRREISAILEEALTAIAQVDGGNSSLEDPGVVGRAEIRSSFSHAHSAIDRAEDTLVVDASCVVSHKLRSAVVRVGRDGERMAASATVFMVVGDDVPGADVGNTSAQAVNVTALANLKGAGGHAASKESDKQWAAALTRGSDVLPDKAWFKGYCQHRLSTTGQLAKMAGTLEARCMLGDQDGVQTSSLSMDSRGMSANGTRAPICSRWYAPEMAVTDDDHLSPRPSAVVVQKDVHLAQTKQSRNITILEPGYYPVRIQHGPAAAGRVTMGLSPLRHVVPCSLAAPRKGAVLADQPFYSTNGKEKAFSKVDLKGTAWGVTMDPQKSFVVTRSTLGVGLSASAQAPKASSDDTDGIFKVFRVTRRNRVRDVHRIFDPDLSLEEELAAFASSRPALMFTSFGSPFFMAGGGNMEGYDQRSSNSEGVTLGPHAWQSRHFDPANKDHELADALRDTLADPALTVWLFRFKAGFGGVLEALIAVVRGGKVIGNISWKEFVEFVEAEQGDTSQVHAQSVLYERPSMRCRGSLEFIVRPRCDIENI